MPVNLQMLYHSAAAAAAAAAKSIQSCPTLCDPIDSSRQGSPVPGIEHWIEHVQARTLEWVATSFSNALYSCDKPQMLTICYTFYVTLD